MYILIKIKRTQFTPVGTDEGEGNAIGWRSFVYAFDRAYFSNTYSFAESMRCVVCGCNYPQTWSTALTCTRKFWSCVRCTVSKSAL